MNISRRSLAIGLGALGAAQGAAYLLYRKVSRERAATGPFAYEPAAENALDLMAHVEQRDGRQVALRTMVGEPLLLPDVDALVAALR